MGLTSQEAEARLRVWGPNERAEGRPPPAWRRLAGRLTNPLVLMLLVAAAISGITGDLASFAVIVVIVLLSVAMDVAQEGRALHAIDALRRKVAVRATALRDGAWVELPIADLVPGDVVRLSAGDLVPADGRLIEVNNLQTDEAVLTGESFPAEKHAGDLAAPAADVEQAANAVFAGASVVGGSGVCVICETGLATRLGEIAGALAARPPPTAFQQGLTRFGMLLLRIALVFVVVVLAESLAFHRPWLEALLFALALAVGLTPELLPMIVTVTLARGAIRLGERRVIVKQPVAIHNLGAMDVLCADKTGTLTEARIAVAGHLDASGADCPRVFELAYVNSVFQTGLKSPLDAAIVAHETLDIAGWLRLGEDPFDFQRRRVTVLAEKAGARRLIMKGAPEDVLSLCALSDGERAELESRVQAIGREGQRTLAVASREVAIAQLTPDVESELTFEGFVTFLDPPKESARQALAELAASGVVVKVLTGDSEEVATHVLRAVGFQIHGALNGRQIGALSDAALVRRVRRVNLFCRVSPTQKLRILLALKRQGQTVGFLGDGVNDAPALHAADVGLSVDSAADVAKAAAPIVLLDKDLGVLSAGVREGRRTVINVDKYVLMAGSANFGNILSMVLAGLFLPFLPLLPIQVLLTNLLYDVAQSGLPFDRVDEEVIRGPVHWDVRRIERFMLVMGPLSSAFDVLTFVILLKVFHADVAFFRTGWFVESLVTECLMIFTVRTRRWLFRSRPHPAVALLAVGFAALALLIPATPIGGWFRFTPLPGAFYGFVFVAAALFLAAMETTKQLVFVRPVQAQVDGR